MKRENLIEYEIFGLNYTKEYKRFIDSSGAFEPGDVVFRVQNIHFQ